MWLFPQNTVSVIYMIMYICFTSLHPVPHTHTFPPLTPPTSHPPPTFTRRPSLPEAGTIPSGDNPPVDFGPASLLYMSMYICSDIIFPWV